MILLACCGGATVVAAPFLSQYPATVSVPASLAGLDKLQNARADALGQEVASQLKRKTSARSAVAGLYAAPHDERHLVLVIGVSGFLLYPAREVDAALTSMGNNGLAVSNIHGYNAGSRGGVVKCGTASILAVAISVCVWGDHGSVGLGIFYNRPVIDSLNLFGKIRRDMVKHG
ncbi:MAG: hypothetical protein QOE03_4149 [Micromonosporaceae bacterium]|jgi:hypothetical protein|nr:hypothetical protein [Micromonosporaceae bacterium]